MPSFSIPLTGLQANSAALSTIGNDLANLNTTAFKSQTVNFADMFYQNVGSSGSGAPLQVGIGTRVASISSDFSQGPLSTTGTATDMALNGDGFFVVNQAGQNQLTRDGSFQLSQTGDLTTSEGFGVQGYPAVDGVVDLNAPLQTLNVPVSQTQLAQSTSNLSFTTSLNASADVGTSFTSSTGVYDSLGQEHNADVTFTKSASNEWTYDVELPSGDATGATGNTGTLTFNADGTLATPTADVTGVTFTGLADNANNLTFNWNLYDSTGKSLVTQGASASKTNASYQDGYASGTYKSFAVGSDGTLTATFTSGGTEVLGQLAVATVSNPQGLTRDGSNLYSTSVASGTIDIGQANTGGRGSIAGDALEQSNVDISTEFADLIVAQRAFEANSKTVTAFDTVMQDTINLIR